MIMFLCIFSGCGSAPPPPSVTPSPQVPETTVPAPPDVCPTEYQTIVLSLLSENGDTDSPHFAVHITFNTDMSLLDENPAHWPITVKRAVPYQTSAGIERVYESTHDIIPDSVTLRGTRTVELLASVEERPFGVECFEVEWDGIFTGTLEGILEGDVYLEGSVGKWHTDLVPLPAEIDLPYGTVAEIDGDLTIFEAQFIDICGDLTGANIHLNNFTGTVGADGYVEENVFITRFTGPICGEADYINIGSVTGQETFGFDGVVETASGENAGEASFALIGKIKITRMLGFELRFAGAFEGYLRGTISFEDVWCTDPFYGLICDEDNYSAYFEAFYVDAMNHYWLKQEAPYNPTTGILSSDEVSWEYTGKAAIADAAGRYCPVCVLEGSGCCDILCPTPFVPICPVE